MNDYIKRLTAKQKRKVFKNLSKKDKQRLKHLTIINKTRLLLLESRLHQSIDGFARADSLEERQLIATNFAKKFGLPTYDTFLLFCFSQWRYAIRHEARLDYLRASGQIGYGNQIIQPLQTFERHYSYAIAEIETKLPTTL